MSVHLLDSNMFSFNKNKYLTAYFKNGNIYKTKPKIKSMYNNRELFYNCRYIVIDRKKFDLENINSIEKITVPNFNYCDTSFLGVTGNLVHILRMKASKLKEDGRIDVALTLLKKATEMMPVSKICWTKDDYMRLPKWLSEVGEKIEAQKAIVSINNLFINLNEKVDEINIQNAKKIGTDLVEAEYNFCCCDECTKFRGRVYSISGNDKRFPKKPQICNCTCSGLDFNPFVYGISTPVINAIFDEEVDIVKFSNRPFVVERTEYERNVFKQQKKLNEKEEEIDRLFEPYRKRLAFLKEEHRKQYEWLCANLPDLAPKSLGGYTRMKNSNSINFQKIVQEAKNKGLDISCTQENRDEMKHLKEIQEAYQKAKMDLYFRKRR